MGKLKKLRKWRSRSRRDAERAETAAERAEAALRRITELAGGDPPGSQPGTAGSGLARLDTTGPTRGKIHGGRARQPAYTRPRAEDAPGAPRTGSETD